MRCCTFILSSAIALMLVAAPSVHARAHAKDRTPEAERLVRDGVDRFSQGSLEQRHKAIRQLEEAARLTPHDPSVLHPLARAYLDAGFTHAAQETFERLTKDRPQDAEAWRGLGQAWKREWLATLAPASLQKAVEYFGNSARLAPGRADVWATLAVLRIEQGDPRGAGLSAERALAANPEQGEASLVGAYLAYRAGRIALAESLFTVTLPRLAPRLAARFREVTPLVTVDDGEALAELSPVQRAEFARRFWSAADPDPTTPANEARVEYWARVAHAVMLFSDTWDAHWDMRAELYIRYGAPAHVAYQPPGYPLAKRLNEYDHLFYDGDAGLRRVGDTVPFFSELHNQVWDYPQLGMRVLIEDRTLSQRYELPRNQWASTDPVPDAEVMKQNGLVSTSGGRGAFAVLPPGAQPLALLTGVSTFEGPHGPLLLAHVSAVLGEQPNLVAECVVVDSSEHEVARESRPLGAARCDPGTSRAGDFSFELPPGPYRVAIAVSDGHGARGVQRTYRDLPPSGTTLSMSALMLVCGPLEAARATSSVRLDPNLAASVGPDEPLLAYFEIYRLQPDAQGVTLFDYEYTVRPLRTDSRPWFRRLFPRQWTDQITVSSPADGMGPTRRQYITVPVQSLPPGRYRLEVAVHDRLGRRSTRQAVEFNKQDASSASEAAAGERERPAGSTDAR